LRGDLELLPLIAEGGLAVAAKDISQAGVVGTAAMLAECSDVGVTIDVAAIPKPAGVPLERWLLTFPSYGYLIAVAPDKVGAVTALFHQRDIAAADIGGFSDGARVLISDGSRHEIIWDFIAAPLPPAPHRPADPFDQSARWSDSRSVAGRRARPARPWRGRARAGLERPGLFSADPLQHGFDCRQRGQWRSP
jgi:phosphoribosylformylglycinamidine (FGAM) synthase-like enzyme